MKQIYSLPTNPDLRPSIYANANEIVALTGRVDELQSAITALEAKPDTSVLSDQVTEQSAIVTSARRDLNAQQSAIAALTAQVNTIPALAARNEEYQSDLIRLGTDIADLTSKLDGKISKPSLASFSSAGGDTAFFIDIPCPIGAKIKTISFRFFERRAGYPRRTTNVVVNAYALSLQSRDYWSYSNSSDLVYTAAIWRYFTLDGVTYQLYIHFLWAGNGALSLRFHDYTAGQLNTYGAVSNISVTYE